MCSGSSAYNDHLIATAPTVPAKPSNGYVPTADFMRADRASAAALAPTLTQKDPFLAGLEGEAPNQAVIKAGISSMEEEKDRLLDEMLALGDTTSFDPGLDDARKAKLDIAKQAVNKNEQIEALKPVLQYAQSVDPDRAAIVEEIDALEREFFDNDQKISDLGYPDSNETAAQINALHERNQQIQQRLPGLKMQRDALGEWNVGQSLLQSVPSKWLADKEENLANIAGLAGTIIGAPLDWIKGAEIGTTAEDWGLYQLMDKAAENKAQVYAQAEPNMKLGGEEAEFLETNAPEIVKILVGAALSYGMGGLEGAEALLGAEEAAGAMALRQIIRDPSFWLTVAEESGNKFAQYQKEGFSTGEATLRASVDGALAGLTGIIVNEIWTGISSDGDFQDTTASEAISNAILGAYEWLREIPFH